MAVKHQSGLVVVILQMMVAVVLLPFLPLFITRNWGWWEAWVYGILFVLVFVVSRLLARRRHPDLLTERARYMQPENVQPWDKILAPLVSIGGGLIPCAAGLEHLLAAPGAFHPIVKILSLVLMLAGCALSTYALVENRFFSGVVRLQTDRGHQPVTGGPYGWVRHPGYAGGLLTYWATPLLLDSGWAFLPAAALTLVLIVRARLEDRFLQDQLPGYADYARRVRYRLIPGLW